MMTDSLLIHFDPKRPDQTVWSTVSPEGELTTKLSVGSLADAAAFSKGRKTVILLDGSYVHLSQLSLPIRNRKKAIQSAPYALEEQLAEDIDDLHFVFDATSKDSTVYSACIAKTTLEDILSLCTASGIEPDAIIPDSLCLAADDNQWALLLDDEMATLQKRTLSASVLDRSNASLIIKHEIESSITKPEKIFLFQKQGEPIESELLNDSSEIEIVPIAYNEHPIVLFCQHYKEAMSLNLLQDSYRPRKKNSVDLSKWKAAASIALAWLVLNLGTTAYLGHQLSVENEKLRAESIKTYRSSFPESKKIINVRVQMEQKLDQLRTSGADESDDLLGLLVSSYKALASDKETIIESMSYKNKQLEISLRSNNLDAINAINNKLNRGTIRSEITSSSSEKNIVRGNIKIRGAES